jgi:hypothetical protein
MAERYSRKSWQSREIEGWQFHLLIGPGESPTMITDVEVIEPSGVRWLGSIGTLAAIDEILGRYRQSGECLGGSYTWFDDLVVLREATSELAFTVLNDMANNGELRRCFKEATSDG